MTNGVFGRKWYSLRDAARRLQGGELLAGKSEEDWRHGLREEVEACVAAREELELRHARRIYREVISSLDRTPRSLARPSGASPPADVKAGHRQRLH